MSQLKLRTETSLEDFLTYLERSYWNNRLEWQEVEYIWREEEFIREYEEIYWTKVIIPEEWVQEFVQKFYKKWWIRWIK